MKHIRRTNVCGRNYHFKSRQNFVGAGGAICFSPPPARFGRSPTSPRSRPIDRRCRAATRRSPWRCPAPRRSLTNGCSTATICRTASSRPSRAMAPTPTAGDGGRGHQRQPGQSLRRGGGRRRAIFSSRTMPTTRFARLSASGVITTVAGNGPAGYSGDGGAATNASLYGPRGVALDAAGNLFIAEFWNQLRPQGGHQRHHHDGGGQRLGWIFTATTGGHQRHV